MPLQIFQSPSLVSIDCISVAHISGSRYIRSYSKHTFSLTRCCQLAFQSICTNLNAWFPGGSVVKNLPVSAEITGDTDSIPTSGRSPGVGKGNHCDILTWEIPWTEEPGGLWLRGRKESNTTEWPNTSVHSAASSVWDFRSLHTLASTVPSFHSHYSGRYGAASLQFYFALLWPRAKAAKRP